MTAQLLDGKKLADHLKTAIKQQVQALTASMHRAPGLAVILAGQDPASRIYVQNKRKACTEAGIRSFAHDLDATVSEQQLVSLINSLNESEEVDGILVQLPLPATINTNRIIECLKPEKDVDGFHPCNLGKLAQRTPLLRPCTPYGIMQLLAACQIPVEGRHAVVIGASNIVGRPMALEFLLAGATVTICHRLTKNLEPLVRQADILVLAAGQCDIVDSRWLHEKQIVIDVGIHRLENGKLRGDINFSEAAKRVAWITPVPGGVGPMTICTLLQNTVLAASMSEKKSH